MSLKPEVSLGVGAAVAALVYGIYSNALPTAADIRSLDSNNDDINATEKHAEWLATAVVAGISLIAKDATIFIIGGLSVVGMSWLHRHANAVNPLTQNVSGLFKSSAHSADTSDNTQPPVYVDSGF